MRIALVVFTPLLMAPFIVTMLMAVQSFQQSYGETLCRMESVRTHAIADVENNRPIAANFGGDACLTPTFPTVTFSLDDVSATPTPDSTVP